MRKERKSGVLGLSLMVALLVAGAVLWGDRHDNVESNLRDSETVFEIEIIPAEQGTYGYDILADGRKIIHQPHIPAIQGMRSFASEQAARRVAEAVIGKLKRGEIPSISVEELKALRAVN